VPGPRAHSTATCLITRAPDLAAGPELRPGGREQETTLAETPESFDVTVIGTGPGGYVAAIRAAQLGLKTAVVEKDPLPGGTCLHWGCIPTKALLHAAEILEQTRRAGTFGVKVAAGELDVAALHKYKDRVVQSNAKGVEFLFKKNGVKTFQGMGKLRGAGKVDVAPAGGGAPLVLTSNHVVLATGSVIRDLPFAKPDGKKILNSDHALTLREIPKSLIVMGAGAVGVEFASIYASFGCKVTIVELLPRLIPIEDEAASAELEKAFRKRGIEVHTGARVEAVDAGGEGVLLKGAKGDKPLELRAEKVLVAVGRRPLTEQLGLEGTRVKLDRGFVEVDAMMRTGEPGLYAIGDLLKTQALAHVASHEGIVAVEHIAGRSPHPIDYDKIPSCTYCSPEVASVGLTEAEARKRGHDVAVGSFPFSAIGKAKILDEKAGFVKIVGEKKHDEVLGVHIVGPHATELIAEATAALSLEATAESLFQAVHAHPTLAEAMGEAALAVHGRAIHI
jgi:dihydrolipoamide dehydrogenase